jgi:hypothetical protein
MDAPTRHNGTEFRPCECDECSEVRHRAELADREIGYETPVTSAAITNEYFQRFPEERLQPGADRLWQVETEALSPGQRPRAGGLWEKWMRFERAQVANSGLNGALNEVNAELRERNSERR